MAKWRHPALQQRSTFNSFGVEISRQSSDAIPKPARTQQRFQALVIYRHSRDCSVGRNPRDS
jgi:hypothetical protein